MNKEQLQKLARELGLNEDASLETVMAAQAERARKEGETAAREAAEAELKRQQEIRDLAAAHSDAIDNIDEMVKAAIDGSTISGLLGNRASTSTFGTIVQKTIARMSHGLAGASVEVLLSILAAVPPAISKHSGMPSTKQMMRYVGVTTW